MWENIGKCGKILVSVGKYWRVWENIGERGKILVSVGFTFFDVSRCSLRSASSSFSRVLLLGLLANKQEYNIFFGSSAPHCKMLLVMNLAWIFENIGEGEYFFSLFLDPAGSSNPAEP